MTEEDSGPTVNTRGDAIAWARRAGGRLKRTAAAHPTLVPLVCGIAVFALLAALITWPVGPLDNSHLPDAGQRDQGASLWGISWVAFALRHGLDVFHTNLIDYPGGVDLGDTPPAPLLGLIAAPVTWGIGVVAAFNFLMWFSLAGSATAMYVVLRQWTRRWTPAFFGGLVFGFNPYMVGQIHAGGHELFMFELLTPPIVWCLYEIFVVQRHSPIRVGLLLGLFCALQSFVSLEVLTDLAVVVLIGVVVAICLHRRDLRRRTSYAVRALVPAAVVFLIAFGWQFYWLALSPDRISGPTQPVSALQGVRVDLFGALVPLSNELLAPGRLASAGASWVAGNLPENGGYLGLPLVLALIGLGIWWRKNAIVVGSIGLAALAYLFSLGNRLNVGGKATSIPLPEAVLPHLPFLANEVPARFSMIVDLFVTIALGVGLDRSLTYLKGRSPARRRRLATVLVASGVLVAVPLLPRAPVQSLPLLWPTSVNTAFRQIPAGTVVLTYPYPTPYFPEAMAWQAINQMGIKLLGGYENVREPNGTSSIELPLLLAPPYAEEYLTQAQFGFSIFPPVSAPNAADETELCSFLSSYGVGAVVAWDAGARPENAIAYLENALGQPSLDLGQVLEWLGPTAYCH